MTSLPIDARVKTKEFEDILDRVKLKDYLEKGIPYVTSKLSMKKSQEKWATGKKKLSIQDDIKQLLRALQLFNNL